MLRFHIQHDSSRYCFKNDGYTLSTSVCDDNDKGQKFKFVTTGHNEGALQSMSDGKCIYVYGSSSLYFRSCSYINSYKSTMVWTCYTPKTAKNGAWEDKDWVGLKLKSDKKCLSVESNGKIKVKPCASVKGDIEQKIIVKDRPGMNLCAKSGYFGERTNDTNYYYFKHEQFKLLNFDRYIRVYMVYGYGVYQAFKSKYSGQEISKIYEHAQDTIGIVDKLYRKARVRMILVGVEVWSSGDKITKATSSYELHNSFKTYIRGVRKNNNVFDDAVYFFDGEMFGAAGTATSNFCRQSNWNEVFIIATLPGDSRLKARDLANTLTHEFAHQVDSYEHTWDPPHSCPTYHLFGARCTLGGNDWPKGLSSNEITKFRKNPYPCLQKKTKQNIIFQCGNGRIDPGEECDCGKSQSCLSNKCCDGQICKLRKNAECSNEYCCDSCKWNRRKSSCTGSTAYLNKNFGDITQPSGKSKHNYQHWKIQTSSGTKIVLFLTMSLFEFEEGCPFDYIKVYDGPSNRYKLLGKFCRTPRNIKVEGSSNNMFVTYKSDGSHESHFKLTYSIQSDVQEDDKKEYFIKGHNGQCLQSSYETLQSSTLCNEAFILTKTHHLKHVKSGKCVEPKKYYNRVYPNAKLEFKPDCTTSAGKFFPLADGQLLNGFSGMCLHFGWRQVYMSTNCNDKNSKVTMKQANGATPPTKAPNNGPQYTIKHSGGRCLAVSLNNELIFSNSCSTKFYLTSGEKLIAVRGSKCFVNKNERDNSLIRTSTCKMAGTKFVRTPAGSIRQVISGRCIHPHNGSPYPNEGQKAVLYKGCDERRLQFTFTKT